MPSGLNIHLANSGIRRTGPYPGIPLMQCNRWRSTAAALPKSITRSVDGNDLSQARSVPDEAYLGHPW